MSLHDEVVAQIRRILPPQYAALLLSPEEVRQFREVLDRAMNTWEPALQPPWLQDLSDSVDQVIAKAQS